MKKRLLLLIFTLTLIMSCAFAQPGNPQKDPDNPVPIQGLGFLIAAGSLFGIFKIIRRNKGSVNLRSGDHKPSHAPLAVLK